MSVLGVAARVLFCEGPGSSLDLALMNRLLDGTMGWTVEPARSKNGLVRFAEGYVQRGGASWLAVRDRDFDQDPSDVPALLADPDRDRRVLCLHRSAVESYLLDAGLIARYWAESEATGRAHYRRPESPVSVESRIGRAARAICAYQAVRWALARVRDDRPRRPTTTWTGGSGHLPSDLGLEGCLHDAEALLRSGRGRDVGAELDTFQRWTREYLARFETEAFWRASGHLIWFSPKDIAKQMQRDDPNLFSLESYFLWAVGQMDWQHHPDLVDLAARLALPHVPR